MAFDFGDPASGFRHIEVVRFINNEVLLNGGGPDFYLALRSRPWNEIEDRLHAVVANPQVPRTMKRASSWSALALSVRVGSRQREQQACRIRQLQDQVEQLEITAQALATERRRLQDEGQHVASQLHFTWVALQQAMSERDMLHGQLLQAERAAPVPTLASDTVLQPPARQLGAMWVQNAEQQCDVFPMGMRVQVPAQAQSPGRMLCIPGSPVPWAMPPTVPMSMPYPYHPRLPPKSPARVVMGAQASAAPFPVPPLGIYPPIPQRAVGFQNMAPPGDQRHYHQEGGHNILQGTIPLGYISSHKQGNQGEPHGIISTGNTKSHSQKEDPESSQGPTSLGVNRSQSQAEAQEKPQGMIFLGHGWRYSQEEDSETSQGLVPLLVENQSQGQEDLEWSQSTVLGGSRSQGEEKSSQRTQEVAPLRYSKSLIEEKGPEEDQANPQGYSFSQDVRENPEEPQAQGGNAQPMKKASDFKHDEKPALSCSPVDWTCPTCKVLNFPWCTSCFKCKKVYTAIESGDQEPGPML